MTENILPQVQKSGQGNFNHTGCSHKTPVQICIWGLRILDIYSAKSLKTEPLVCIAWSSSDFSISLVHCLCDIGLVKFPPNYTITTVIARDNLPFSLFRLTIIWEKTQAGSIGCLFCPLTTLLFFDQSWCISFETECRMIINSWVSERKLHWQGTSEYKFFYSLPIIFIRLKSLYINLEDVISLHTQKADTHTGTSSHQILLLSAHAYIHFAWELQLDNQCVHHGVLIKVWLHMWSGMTKRCKMRPKTLFFESTPIFAKFLWAKSVLY